MAVKIAITNLKGGVGKTTTAINIADALRFMGFKTLFVDLDPQMNSTSVYTRDFDIEGANTLRDVIRGGDIEECIMEADMGDIVLGDQSLADEEDKVYQYARKHPERLREELSKVDDEYQFVIMDCPPNAGTWFRNALYAADGLVIPFTAKTFAVDGLGWLLQTIDRIKNEGNPDLKVLGVVLTMYDRRNRQDREIAMNLPALGEALNFHAFATNVNICQDVENVIAQGQSLFENKGNSAGAVDYVHLVHEILREVSEYGNN